MLKTMVLTASALLANSLPCLSIAAPPAGLQLVPVATQLTRPVAARHAGDGSGRLFIVEQPGRILILDQTDTLLATPFLDITSAVDNTGNEQGLLGLEFDPDFASNGFFYVNYTYDPGPGSDRTRVSRFSVSVGDSNVANAGSEHIIIEIQQDFSNHNGGDIHFGPDGYLYIGMGDGGSGGDPKNRAQTLSADGSHSLLGKMLRIDVHDSGAEPGGVEKCGEVQNYSIPHTTGNDQIANPWLGADGVCDEIWTYGWRNPWRWSFDKLTGDMFVGDVGQGDIEEISWQAAADPGGGNYGWNCKEGSSVFNAGCEFPGNFIDPILEFLHSGTGACSVTGGYVYRGRISAMWGDYIYSDFCNGNIWFASQSGSNWNETLWQDTNHRPTAFGEDEAGELYLVHIGGDIYRFVDVGVFDDGFESIP